MGAKVLDGAGGSGVLTVGPTSKAAWVTLYDANGREVVRKPTLGSFIANILIRQSAATVTGNIVWSLFNSDPSTLVRIRNINFWHIFDGAATATGTTYAWYKTNVVAPTGGSTITPTKKRSGDSASVCDVRFLDTGLTQGNLVKNGDPFFRTNVSVNGATGVYERYTMRKAAGFRRTGGHIEIGPTEGIAMALFATGATIGQGACGFVEWDEVSLS